MKILLTVPSFAPHGGIRVLLEWANRLTWLGHEVTILLGKADYGHSWFGLDGAVEVTLNDSVLDTCDCWIIGSPHHAGYLDNRDGTEKRFAFAQMAEHLFRPTDGAWRRVCERFFLTRYPLFGISRWNLDLAKEWGRTGPTHYITNGVNLQHFPVSHEPKRGKCVLVEGWAPTNPTKDTERVAAKVARRLRSEGYRILAYGMKPLDKRDIYRAVPHEYAAAPSLAQLNELYERAVILVKATHCDARSCSPMEAMTKGTVTARAIEQGDDDLVDGENCLRVGYNADDLYYAAKRLLTNPELRESLASRCREYVQAQTWDRVIAEVNGILTADTVAPCNA